LPPIQQGREFHSLDSSINSKTQKQPIEMGFHGPPCHFELARNFGVVTSLQKQGYDLLFARTQPNGLLLHRSSSPYIAFALIRRTAEVFPILVAPTMPL
jgi:hypothetical protein